MAFSVSDKLSYKWICKQLSLKYIEGYNYDVIQENRKIKNLAW